VLVLGLPARRAAGIDARMKPAMLSVEASMKRERTFPRHAKRNPIRLPIMWVRVGASG